MTLAAYMITCLTEQKRVVTPFMDTVPNTCPNDTSHTIDPSQTKIYKSMAPKVTTICEKEEGWFQTTSINYTIPAASTTPVTTTFDTSWPADVYLFSTKMYCDTNSAGDNFSVICAPDTLLGTTTDNISTGSKIIPVSPTITANVIRGLDITLSDGTNRNDLGRILSIDTINYTLTVENSTTNDFLSGVNVLMNFKCVRDFQITSYMISPGIGIEIGNRALNGKLVPANTIMRILYTNTTNSQKMITFFAQFLVTA